MSANVLQCMAMSHVKPDDTLVGVLPFYHIYGFTVILNMAVCAGAKVVTMPSVEPGLFLKVCTAHTPSFCTCPRHNPFPTPRMPRTLAPCRPTVPRGDMVVTWQILKENS